MQRVSVGPRGLWFLFVWYSSDPASRFNEEKPLYPVQVQYGDETPPTRWSISSVVCT